MQNGTHTHPGAVIGRLTEIENDLAERQNEFEQAAGDRARLTREWERRFAISLAQAKGSDANARKASALVTAIEQDDLYTRLKEAEASFEALRAVMKVLETRSVIGTSILRAQGRA